MHKVLITRDSELQSGVHPMGNLLSELTQILLIFLRMFIHSYKFDSKNPRIVG